MATEAKTVHQGRNLKRIREILNIKQSALASQLGEDWNQKKISQLEDKEVIEPALLAEIASALKVPVDAINNFDEKTAINIIAETVNNHDQSASVFYNAVVNPIDKWLEALEENKRLIEKNEKLYERLLQSEKEKIQILEREHKL